MTGGKQTQHLFRLTAKENEVLILSTNGHYELQMLAAHETPDFRGLT